MQAHTLRSEAPHPQKNMQWLGYHIFIIIIIILLNSDVVFCSFQLNNELKKLDDKLRAAEKQLEQKVLSLFL